VGFDFKQASNSLLIFNTSIGSGGGSVLTM
jgi:hypothetical protein